jgi:hypothetical protein
MTNNEQAVRGTADLGAVLVQAAGPGAVRVRRRPLLIRALLGATLAAPRLLVWRWPPALGRTPRATHPARFGDREVGSAGATWG